MAGSFVQVCLNYVNGNGGDADMVFHISDASSGSIVGKLTAVAPNGAGGTATASPLSLNSGTYIETERSWCVISTQALCAARVPC